MENLPDLRFQTASITKHFFEVSRVTYELKEKIEKGTPERYFHKLGPSQWDYFEELAQDSKMESVKPVIPAIFNKVHGIRNVKLLTYRQSSYKITGPETFISIDPPQA